MLIIEKCQQLFIGFQIQFLTSLSFAFSKANCKQGMLVKNYRYMILYIYIILYIYT